MRTLLPLSALLIMTTQAPAAMTAGLVDPLQSLYPDSDPALASPAMEIDVARRSTAAVHIFLTGLQVDQPLSISLRQADKPVQNAAWFRLIDVPVEKNTGPVGFVETAKEQNPTSPAAPPSASTMPCSR